MGDDPGHGYDSFVVRMWRDRTGVTVLRAEVEHVQSGAVDVRIGDRWPETFDWLRSRLLKTTEEPDVS